MSTCTCPITGITFSIKDGFNSDYTTHHPLSNLNTIKRTLADFNKGSMPTDLAIGAVIGILSAHKLLAKHNPWNVVELNKELCKGFNKHTANLLAKRLIDNDAELAKARSRKEGCPKFSVDSVERCKYESDGQYQKLIPAFKLWINDVLPMSSQEIVLSTEDKALVNNGIEVRGDVLELADGSLVAIAEKDDVLLRTYINEAVKLSRRKSLDYTKYRLNYLIKVVSDEEHGELFSIEQQEKLAKMIKAGKIPVKIIATCVNILHTAIISGPSTANVRLHYMQALSWFRAFEALPSIAATIGKDVASQINTGIISDTQEQKESNSMSLLERIKAKQSKAQGV